MEAMRMWNNRYMVNGLEFSCIEDAEEYIADEWERLEKMQYEENIEKWDEQNVR